MSYKQLSDSQLRAIKLFMSAGHTDKQIADHYKISESYVSVLRRTWGK